jgi:hypothetical protein
MTTALRPAGCRLDALAALAAVLLAGCAVPATQVEVSTLPMRSAFELSRQAASPPAAAADPVPRLVPAPLPRGAQRPLLSAPDVRLAYLYEWIDTEGNKHFGEWVAIPVAGFNWIMNDGAHQALDGSTGDAAPAAERN